MAHGKQPASPLEITQRMPTSARKRNANAGVSNGAARSPVTHRRPDPTWRDPNRCCRQHRAPGRHRHPPAPPSPRSEGHISHRCHGRQRGEVLPSWLHAKPSPEIRVTGLSDAVSSRRGSLLSSAAPAFLRLFEEFPGSFSEVQLQRLSWSCFPTFPFPLLSSLRAGRLCGS